MLVIFHLAVTIM